MLDAVTPTRATPLPLPELYAASSGTSRRSNGRSWPTTSPRSSS